MLSCFVEDWWKCFSDSGMLCVELCSNGMKCVEVLLRGLSRLMLVRLRFFRLVVSMLLWGNVLLGRCS